MNFLVILFLVLCIILSRLAYSYPMFRSVLFIFSYISFLDVNLISNQNTSSHLLTPLNFLLGLVDSRLTISCRNGNGNYNPFKQYLKSDVQEQEWKKNGLCAL